MRLLADLHISPRTVAFLRSRGHDVVRVTDLLPATASDEAIVERAAAERRTVVTQDLDLSTIVALARTTTPSILVLRLSASRVEHVNDVLLHVLVQVEPDLLSGAIVTADDGRVRVRKLPVE